MKSKNNNGWTPYNFFKAINYNDNDVIQITLWNKGQKAKILETSIVEISKIIEKYNGVFNILFYIQPLNRIKTDLIVVDYDFEFLPKIDCSLIVNSGSGYHLYFLLFILYPF